jgi:tetratricopeptide (TPR) repeat protein
VKAASLIVAASILIAPAAVHAEAWSGTVPAKARALADRGRALHDAADYANAIAAFTQAYALAPSPALLFNLAQAYRLLGNCGDAVLMYRRYLETNPSSGGRALAKSHLATVERCMHKLALHIPIEPAIGRLVVPPPPEALAATTTTTVVTGRSRTAQLEEDLGTGLALGGGVALAVAAYYALQAHDAANDVTAAYAMGAQWKDIAPIDDRGRTAARTAKLLGTGGALGIASGVVMYMIGRHTERPPVAVGPLGHGVEVSMSWAY